jgi:DNA (cytosine-5)-methyltransferase 1
VRFLSLFSGIESASCAWESLGWTCAAVAEIEPFPCALLAHYFPQVPNLGDVTKITQTQIEALGAIDLIVFGFPCQDVSIAGERAGLTNADGTLTRSGLFFHAAQIAEWSRARWTVAENVPGLLSNNEGRDFAAVVGELSGAELGVPGDGWRNAGVALGPKGLVEWITLDAQFIRVESHARAVPQRRRRVFLVRDSGDWSGREPLFLEPESLRGNPPPRREAREGVAGTVTARAGNGSRPAGANHNLAAVPVANSLTNGAHPGGLNGQDAHDGRLVAVAFGGNDTRGPVEVATAVQAKPALTSNYAKQPDNSDTDKGPNLIATAFKPSHYTREKDGAPQNIAFPLTSDADKGDQDQVIIAGVIGQNGSDIQAGDGSTTGTLGAAQERQTSGDLLVLQPCIAFSCKDSGQYAGQDVAPTLRSMNETGGNAGGQVAVAFDCKAGANTGFAIGDIPGALRGEGHGGGHAAIQLGMSVRRLTPLECERLQGFPDGWTKLPSAFLLKLGVQPDPENPKHWTADSPRYKALGNSKAVNVVRHIGERIAFVQNSQNGSFSK